MVPVTVVAPVWIVVAPAPESVPEMVPPSSVLAPDALTVPARSPPLCPKVVVVSVAEPLTVPPVCVRAATVSAALTVSMPVPDTTTVEASAKLVPVFSVTVPPETVVPPPTLPL